MHAKKWEIQVVVLCLCLGAVSTCLAKVIYVNDNATGANDGSSWDDAYNHLQDALADANSAAKPVEVRVAQGAYRPDEDTLHPDGTGSREATFQLINDVTLKGGYAGLGQPDPNVRDVELYETILSGDMEGNDPDFNDSDWQSIFDYTSDANMADNSYSVVNASGNADSAVLDGFTITGGYANGPILGLYPDLDYHLAAGAGMYNASGSPTVLNCTFRRNATSSTYGYSGKGYPSMEVLPLGPKAGAGYYCSCNHWAETCGAGMFNCSANPTLRNCTFEQNICFGADAFSAGAGMFNADSNPVLVDCIFSRNIVTGFDSEYNDAGMYNHHSSPSLTNCSFIANVSQFSATGAMVNTADSNAILTNCTFIANTSEEGAGAISIFDSDPVLADCTFTDNSGYFGGAVLVAGHCRPELINCTFLRNNAAEGGAVKTSFRSSPMIAGCTFTGNSAYEGGGIHNSGAWYYDPNSSAVISGCTFIGNQALRGGGMHNAWNRKTTVRNCLFVGNNAEIGGGVSYYGSEQNMTNCTFADNQAERGTAVACDSHDAAYPSKVQITNSIIWNGEASVFNGDSSDLRIAASNVQGGWPGIGNIDSDPCFAEPGYWDANETPEDANDDSWVDGDYHLKSQAGRWDPNSQTWIIDDVTSPCIDAGNPMSPIGNEPFPNGGIINMGAYGGTAEASKSYFGRPLCEVIAAGDVNGDCIIDFKDFVIMGLHWCEDHNP